MKRNAFTLVELLICLAIVAILAMIVAGGIGGCMNHDGNGQPNTQGNRWTEQPAFTAKVVRKYEFNKSDGDGGSYTVYRVDVQRADSTYVETLENIDDFWHGKRNSATVHANLTEGEWYTFNVRGVRNENWSMFPNIERVSSASPPQTTQESTSDLLNTAPPTPGEVTDEDF